ncbi:MAG TPA: hypothetical protein VGK74_11265, partial [Symbiobacteriaceae bacterium]
LAATCWVHAPAVVQLSALAYTRLGNVAAMAGLKVKVVPKVQAKIIGKSKVLLLRAAADTDRTAYEVHRYTRSAGGWVNLFELLGSYGLTVESGYRDGLTFSTCPRAAPSGPAS